MGQVYVPQVNWALMVSTIVIVIGFGSSTALAAAYGIAVTLTMVITAVLLQVVAIERWGWPPAVAYAVTGVFLTIDLAFFGANALKIAHGGWLPLVIGGLLFTLMTTWKTGRQLVAARLTARAVPIEDFLRQVVDDAARARAGHRGVHDGAAARHAAGAGAQPALQQGAARARRHADGHDPAGAARAADAAGHGPRAGPGRVRRRRSATASWRIPTCPRRWSRAREQGLELDEDDVTYFLGRETLIVTTNPGMAMWRERLFVLMARNAVRATTFFRLPPERVVELGVQVEI